MYRRSGTKILATASPRCKVRGRGRGVDLKTILLMDLARRKFFVAGMLRSVSSPAAEHSDPA